MSTTTDNGQLTKDVVEKYLKEDYKAFIFATHPLHGLLLLYCTRKKKKGPHYQAPGGHVDKEDYDHVIAQMSSSSTTVQGPELLMQACKMGAARELFEETGLDFRSTVDR
jgi:8-oxo-dGTP pyrophosphatase MutT (NUDIX family)